LESRLGPALAIDALASDALGVDAARWMPPPEDASWRTVPIVARPGARVYSHENLRERAAAGLELARLPADLGTALQRAVEHALQTGSALLVRVERIRPPLAPLDWPRSSSFWDEDDVAPDVGVHDAVPAEEFLAAAKDALEQIGLGDATLTLPDAEHGSVVGAPIVTAVHDGQTWREKLPRSTQDLPRKSRRLDVEAYWRTVQPAWEQLVVRSLFPVEGPGFVLRLGGMSWSSSGVTAEVSVLLASAPVRSATVVFPRVLLDGWHDLETAEIGLPLVESHARIRSWRRTIARMHVDSMHDVGALFEFFQELYPRP
jgi:hypothetical protein